MKNVVTTEVIEALRNGDHQAFEIVFIAYFSKTKVFISQLIRSEEDAEELAQEIFLQLWISHSKINTTRSFSSLLYTVSKNAAFNYLKHEKVKENFSFQYILLENNENPEEVLFAKEMALLVEMAISKMPAQRQKIVRMSRHEGLNHDEIAEKLQITRKTVENQLSMGLRDIRKVLQVSLTFFSEL